MRAFPCLLLAASAACGADALPHGAIAEGIMAPLGDPLPAATAEQRATFERGRSVALRRFDRRDGLGPAFNVTFCAACHERPVAGGSAGLYRNFFLTGRRTPDGAFFPGTSAGMSGGVLRMYFYGSEEPARPRVPDTTTIITQRNPIAIFGTGLIAEIEEDEILGRADPEDEDGDGISGRANFERGFVGRFGRKAQTASVEGFIRGPLFNHLGITTSPLTDAQRALLPVDSSSRRTSQAASGLRAAQAAVADEALTDQDPSPDPELGGDDLFDLISFAMLLAIAPVEPSSDASERGRQTFDRVGCGDCHTPRLNSPRGPLPIYSDLLIHDLGPELADGIEQGLASGSEFRTQPLWGVSSVGPYLHDGRAETLEEAIRQHGGEASASRDHLLGLGDAAVGDVVEFLGSLGGRDRATPGLLPPNAPIPAPGEWGGPRAALEGAELERFALGRGLFDKDFGYQSGAGAPRFNGDSCRACHFDPVIGGAGPRDVNVMRHGILGGSGEFIAPTVGTILHKETRLPGIANVPQKECDLFEPRQTPHLFGLGLIEAIPAAEILSRADPEDQRAPDGISGRPAWTDDGRLGRFGWKAQVPSIAEFVRDAMSAEIGLTVEPQEGLTFGRLHDDDPIPDPELSRQDAELVADFLRSLAPPPRAPAADAGRADRGAELFAEIGCAACHTPALASAAGDVHLYSDLLLHQILPPGGPGIEDGTAAMGELRTAPLWGLRATAPYWHTGEADTVPEAIELHDGEARATRERYRSLSDPDRGSLLLFLETL
jgi:CxxC motif-containing protein (DUF1111 family)